MRVWRIDKARYAAEALRGEGARIWGGRWNPPGRAVVYTSATLSLAALETLVHFDVDLAPENLVAVAIDVPDSLALAVLDGELDPQWRDDVAWTQRRGLAWLDEAGSAVLSVASSVIPEERNYILNPAHPDFGGVAIAAVRPFAFDARLLE